MTVRRAKIEDAESIFQFIQELEEVALDYSLFLRYYLVNLSCEDNIYLVAAADDETVAGYLSCHGQILLHHLSKVFEIQELFVKKDFRNRSIGQILIQTLEKVLKENGYIFLEVTANVNRKSTHRFYLNCGFDNTHLKFTKTLK